MSFGGSQVRSVAKVCIASLGVLGGAWSGFADARAAELRIDFNELSTLASAFLSNAKVRFHNAQSGLFDFSAGSSITIGGVEQPIPVPAYKSTALGVPFVYLINDLNSTKITVSPVKGAVRLSAAFESDGPELVGRCLSDLCPSDAVLPQFEWQKAVVNIDLVPTKIPAGLSLKAEHIEVQGEITPHCRSTTAFLAGPLCQAALPKARAMIARMRSDLNGRIRDQLNAGPIQDKIANALKGYLKLGPAGDVQVSRVLVESSGKAVVVSFCLACAAN